MNIYKYCTLKDHLQYATYDGKTCMICSLPQNLQPKEEKKYNVCQQIGCGYFTNGEKFCSQHDRLKKEHCKCEDKNTDYHLKVCCQPIKPQPKVKLEKLKLPDRFNEFQRDLFMTNMMNTINEIIEKITEMEKR